MKKLGLNSIHYSCPQQSNNLYVKPQSYTHTVDIWTQSQQVYHCREPARPICLSSRSGAVTTALQRALCVWINLPGWLLIWRWVGRHPPTPKLISLCHRTMRRTIPPPTPMRAQRIAKYLHLSLSHLHGRGQQGGWLVRGRKVNAMKEFIIRRCQSLSLGEQMKWSGRRRGWEGGRMGGRRVEGNTEKRRGSVLCLSGYWLSAKSSSWPTELAAIHCVQINHYTVCVFTITCRLWLNLNYEKRTYALMHPAPATNGHLVVKNTPEASLKHQKLVSQTHIQSFRNDHARHPLHSRVSGMRQTACNSIRPTAVCLGPSVQSIVFLCCDS